ncbi:hypothetical protein D6833_11375 [Candidatus Parcubacteria bacterium]|nr:MAG: hypothetical protein D6833_11375 [Candidatus Parcubacteria bacterium]
MRIPTTWRKALREERLLIASPFDPGCGRPTLLTSARRNRFVAICASEILVANAVPGSKTEALCHEILAMGKRLWLLGVSRNSRLAGLGARVATVEELIRYAAEKLSNAGVPR